MLIYLKSKDVYYKEAFKFIDHYSQLYYLFMSIPVQFLFVFQSFKGKSSNSSLFASTERYIFICFGNFCSSCAAVKQIDPVFALLFLSQLLIESFHYWSEMKNTWSESFEVIVLKTYDDKSPNVSKYLGSWCMMHSFDFFF